MHRDDSKQSAYLVNTDDDGSAVLTVVFARAGLIVTVVRTLEEVLQRWVIQPGDLLLIAVWQRSPQEDIMRVRQEIIVPLIVVVDTLTEHDHSTMLQHGADLVLARPYGAALLVAQIQALLRRTSGIPFAMLQSIVCRDAILDPRNHTVRRPDAPVQRLSKLEFRLLYMLMTHPGQTLSSDRLIEAVWGYDGSGDDSLVRNLIKRLRTKLGDDPANPRYIQTLPTKGYMFLSESLSQKLE